MESAFGIYVIWPAQNRYELLFYHNKRERTKRLAGVSLHFAGIVTTPHCLPPVLTTLSTNMCQCWTAICQVWLKSFWWIYCWFIQWELYWAKTLIPSKSNAWHHQFQTIFFVDPRTNPHSFGIYRFFCLISIKFLILGRPSLQTKWQFDASNFTCKFLAKSKICT